MGSQQIEQAHQKRRSRKLLLSFPDYVNKVQNKMSELKIPSLTSSKAESKQSMKYSSPLKNNTKNTNYINRSAISKGKSKRSGSPGRILSCFDPEASPTIALRSKPLPRTLSPINTSRNSFQRQGRKARKLKGKEQLVESVSARLKAQAENTMLTSSPSSSNSRLNIRKEAPLVKSAGDARNPPHVKAKRDDPNRESSPYAHMWNRKMCTHPSNNMYLSLPRGIAGTSMQSLSSSGSSSNSSSRSTPLPPTPSPLPHTSLSPSTASLSSNEVITDIKLSDTCSIASIHHNEVAPHNNKTLQERSSNSARTHLNKSSSLPQLARGLSPRLPRSPVCSLGRTPTRSPVPSPYLMPVTKLYPMARPPRLSLSSPANHKLKMEVSSVNRIGRHRSSLSESSKNGYEDVSADSAFLPPVVSIEVTTSDHNEEHSIINTNPSHSSIAASTLPLLDKTLELTSHPDHHNSLVGVVHTEASSQQGLKIPLITIRSATPTKTPSEDSDSLTSLCDEFVFSS